MSKFSLILCLASLIFWVTLDGKKEKNPRPAWVDNPALEYHALQYLSAVGIGSTRAHAEDNARANLAKIFQTKVSSSSGYEERYQELVDSENSSFSNQTEQSATVKVLSSQTLSNVKIGPSWTDDLGRVYALAYLHRSSTAEIQRRMIEDNSKQIMALLTRAVESSTIWENYALLSAAEKISQTNQELLAQMRILSSDEAALISLPYDAEILSAQMDAIKQKISFNVSSTDDEALPLLTQVKEVITNLGFKVSENAENQIRVSYQTQELNLDNPTYKYIRYQMNISVIDHQGREMFNFSDSNREAHFSFADAKDRALRTAAEKISQDFKQKFQSYLLSQNLLDETLE